jgi:predicted alpha/beta-hydrolase family hydrolase
VTVAVLAPGYGGTAEQPLLKKLAARLEAHGIACARVTFSTKGSRPSRGYETELSDLRAARDGLLATSPGPVVLIGRSFGGRMCAFLAEQDPPAALVVLGHPISPPNRPRPQDEATLAALTCPTLILQGDRDELGPLPVLERLAAQNPQVELSVLPNTGHDLGKQEAAAIERAVEWVLGILAL